MTDLSGISVDMALLMQEPVRRVPLRSRRESHKRMLLCLEYQGVLGGAKW